MTNEELVDLHASVKRCMEQYQVSPAIIEKITVEFEQYLKTKPASEHPLWCVDKVSVSKFKKITPNDVPFHQGGVYAFPTSITLGLTYRWVTVSFTGAEVPHSFLLVTPNSVSVDSIRRQIKNLGYWGFCNTNDLGRTYQPNMLNIQHRTKHIPNNSPIAYMTLLPEQGNQGNVAVALGIVG